MPSLKGTRLANMVAQNGRECERITDACKLRGEGCVKQATGPVALCVVMAMDRSFAMLVTVKPQ